MRLPKDGRQAAVDDIHEARHPLRSKRASKSTDKPSNSGPTKAEAPTRVHQRKQYARPTIKTPREETGADMQVFVDSDGAGCPTTRKSSIGFLIKVFGQQCTTEAEHSNDRFEQRWGRSLRNQKGGGMGSNSARNLW